MYFILYDQIHSVEDFVCSVNAHLTTRQENERLKGIMARIESYDVVVSMEIIFSITFTITSSFNTMMLFFFIILFMYLQCLGFK